MCHHLLQILAVCWCDEKSSIHSWISRHITQVYSFSYKNTSALSGYYIHHQFNLLETAGNFPYHQVLHSIIIPCDNIAFMCFVRLSEQTVAFALYIINRLVFISEVENIYCAVVLSPYTEWSKSLCAPDDYSTKNMQKYFKQFQSLTMIT
jgi:hypothetical protein